MRTIESGVTKKRFGAQKRDVNYEMIPLEDRHLPDIMKLQDIIMNNLTDHTIFNASSEAFMRQHIETKGRMIGIFAENELIAYHALYFPESDDKDYNLGADLGFPEKEINTFLNFQDILVHPEFRGNQLGLKMNNCALNSLNHTEYRHLFATVSPFNIHSVRLFFNSGFLIRDLKYKYNEKLRYIFYKDIAKPPRVVASEDEIILSNEEIQAQQDIIRKGYCGTAFREVGNKIGIIYKLMEFDY